MNVPQPKKIYRASTATALRVGRIFHRKATSIWTELEYKAFKLLLPFDEDDLALVERYYEKNWPPRNQVNILRTALITFLNNYPGELDRARIWCAAHPVVKPPRKIIPLPKMIEGEMTEEERLQSAAEFEKLMGRAPKLAL